MRDKEIEAEMKQFCDQLQEINRIYEDYARSVDIPYTTLQILDLITKTENCTQKIICERTFLPKQTVNNVITTFYKQGYVRLQELPEDRRNKTIHLTESGQEYADKVIPQIREAEYGAMEKLTPQQRKNLLESMRIYSEMFRKVMPAGEW
mgnify:CR=1 FL=1